MVHAITPADDTTLVTTVPGFEPGYAYARAENGMPLGALGLPLAEGQSSPE